MARFKLGELLVRTGIIDSIQLRSALAEQRKWGTPLGVTLVGLGMINESTLVNVLSHQLNIPSVDLETGSISPTALQFLDYDFCIKHSCIPFHFTDKGNFLDVAMFDPTNTELFDLIRVETKSNIRPHLAGQSAIDNAIRRSYLASKKMTDDEVDTGKAVQKGAEGLLQQEKVLGQGQGPGQGPARQGWAQMGTLSRRVEKMDQELVRIKAVLRRDEHVMRKLMSILVEKKVCTGDDLREKLSEE